MIPQHIVGWSLEEPYILLVGFQVSGEFGFFVSGWDTTVITFMNLVTVGDDETCACSVHRFRKGLDPLTMLTNIRSQIVLGYCMMHIIDYAELQLYFIRIPFCIMQLLRQGRGSEVGYRNSSCSHRCFDKLPSIDICLVGLTIPVFKVQQGFGST